MESISNGGYSVKMNSSNMRFATDTPMCNLVLFFSFFSESHVHCGKVSVFAFKPPKKVEIDQRIKKYFIRVLNQDISFEV